VRWLDHRLTVIVLTNRNDPPPYGLALAIAAAFLPGGHGEYSDRLPAR
jgi:hypothetical protein